MSVGDVVLKKVGEAFNLGRKHHIGRVYKVHAVYPLVFGRQDVVFFSAFGTGGHQGHAGHIASFVQDGEAFVVGVPGQQRVIVIGGLLWVTDALFKYLLAFAGLDILHVHFPFADVVAHPGHAFAVGAQAHLAQGVLAFVFDSDARCGFGIKGVAAFVLVALGEILHHGVGGAAVSATQHVQKSGVDAAVDARKVEQVADGTGAKVQADVVPEGVASQPRVVFGQFIKRFVLFREEEVAEHLVVFGRPGFAAIGTQAVGVPPGQVEEYGILDDFLQVGAEKHGVDEYACHAFADLAAEVLVVAVEVYKHLVAHHFGFAGAELEDVVGADVALFEVAEVAEDQHFKFFGALVFEQLLNGGKIILAGLQGGLCHVAGVAVPIGDEISGFVIEPPVNLSVVLHPVFAEGRLRSGLGHAGLGQS